MQIILVNQSGKHEYELDGEAKIHLASLTQHQLAALELVMEMTRLREERRFTSSIVTVSTTPIDPIQNYARINLDKGKLEGLELAKLKLRTEVEDIKKAQRSSKDRE